MCAAVAACWSAQIWKHANCALGLAFLGLAHLQPSADSTAAHDQWLRVNSLSIRWRRGQVIVRCAETPWW
jgi:hypothetical protein